MVVYYVALFHCPILRKTYFIFLDLTCSPCAFNVKNFYYTLHLITASYTIYKTNCAIGMKNGRDTISHNQRDKISQYYSALTIKLIEELHTKKIVFDFQIAKSNELVKKTDLHYSIFVTNLYTLTPSQLDNTKIHPSINSNQKSQDLKKLDFKTKYKPLY